MKKPLAFVAAVVVGSSILSTRQSIGQVGGSLDSSFGIGGKVFTTFGPTYSNAAHAIVQQPDGKVVVAGGGPTGLQLARYNSNGSLDPSFGVGGTVTVNLGSSPPSGSSPFGSNSPAFGLDIVLQPTDGKIIVGGMRGHQCLLIRYNTNGTIDTSFGTNGLVTQAYSLYATTRKLMFDSTGRLVVLVAYDTIGGTNGLIIKYSPSGVPSITAVPIATGGGYFTATTALIDPSDNIVVAGFVSPARVLFPTNYHPAVLRLLPSGDADISFGDQGAAVLTGAQPNQALGLARQADGKVVVSTSNSTLWRIGANGVTDAVFGTAGIVNFATSTTQPLRLMQPLIQADGRIVAVGMQTTGLASDFAIVRAFGNGVPDASFGNGGRLIFSEQVFDAFYDAVLQPDGNLVAAGYTSATISPPAPVLFSQQNPDSSRVAVCRILTGTTLATHSQAGTHTKLAVYPNPASDILRIEVGNLPKGSTPIRLQLSNSIGQLVRYTELSRQNNTTTTLSVSGLAPGIYWLRGQVDGREAVLSQPIVVE